MRLCVPVAIIACAGCASSEKIVQADLGPSATTGAYTKPIVASMHVWVLSPKLVYEDVRNETVLDPAAYRGPEIARMLTDTGLAALRSKGVREVRAVESCSLTAERKSLAELAAAEADRLFLSSPDPQVLQALKKFAGADESSEVLVQYARIKVGPGGFYDPLLTGAVRAGASSVHLSAALIECGTGSVRWQNSVLLRELPKPDSSNFLKALQQLYSTLKFQP